MMRTLAWPDLVSSLCNPSRCLTLVFIQCQYCLVINFCRFDMINFIEQIALIVDLAGLQMNHPIAAPAMMFC